MGAETHDVYLSHSGAQIIQKTSGEQEGEEEWLGYLSCIGLDKLKLKCLA
jgi:hypothetical protein